MFSSLLHTEDVYSLVKTLIFQQGGSDTHKWQRHTHKNFKHKSFLNFLLLFLLFCCSSFISPGDPNSFTMHVAPQHESICCVHRAGTKVVLVDAPFMLRTNHAAGGVSTTNTANGWKVLTISLFLCCHFISNKTNVLCKTCLSHGIEWNLISQLWSRMSMMSFFIIFLKSYETLLLCGENF